MSRVQPGEEGTWNVLGKATCQVRKELVRVKRMREVDVAGRAWRKSGK